MADKRRRETIRAEVVSLAKGGDGVARRLDGPRATLFVPGTAPGDVVRVAVEGRGRGRLLEIVEASPERVPPPCPHAEACGGCDWMHLRAEAQRRGREAIVRQALERAGLEVPAIGSHAPGPDLRYRGRARFAARAGDDGVVVGLRAARSHRVVPIRSCLVLLPELDATRDEIAAWLEGSRGRGDVSVTRGTGGLPSIHLAWQGELAPSVFALAEQHVTEGRWAGTSVLIEGATVPAVSGDPRGVTRGADGLPLIVPPGGFMQANEQMNLELVRHVNAEAAPEGRPTLELFAGAGNFTVCLAAGTDALETVEQVADAVDAARVNLERRALRARQRVGDAEAAKVRDVVRVAVLDPPRSGAPGASSRLASSKARAVVMVSCDPATLARDAATLTSKGRFALQRVQLFDMFPQTSHVETVATFRRVR